MLQSPHDQRWYWFGESRKEGSSGQGDKQGINCYSSATIAGPWRNEGQVLAQSDIHVTGAHGPWIMQRPKVIYNNNTMKFVMYFHLDQPKSSPAQPVPQPPRPARHSEEPLSYQFRRVGVATAHKASGPYTFIHGVQPDGVPSLDMNLFQDNRPHPRLWC